MDVHVHVYFACCMLHVCVYVRMYVCVHVCMLVFRGQASAWHGHVVLNHLHPVFLTPNLSLGLGLTRWLHWQASEPRGSSRTGFPRAGITSACSDYVLPYLKMLASKSCPHAHTASTSTLRPLPGHSGRIFYHCHDYSFTGKGTHELLRGAARSALYTLIDLGYTKQC